MWAFQGSTILQSSCALCKQCVSINGEKLIPGNKTNEGY